MRLFTHAATYALILPLVLGCEAFDTTTAAEQGHQRWNDVRARLKAQLAADSLAKGRLDAAERHVAEAIGLSPDDPSAHVLRAKILLERGQTAAAAEALDRAVERGGDDAQIDYLYGLIAQRYGHFDVALAWYQRAFERDPHQAHYVVAMAEMLVAADRASEALELVRARWTDFEDNVAIRALAGDIYIMLGRYEEAAQAYRVAVQASPNDPHLAVRLGTCLARSGSHLEAREVLSAAVEKMDPVPGSVLIELGRCHLAMNELIEARAAFRGATEINPDQPRGWSWLARTAIEADDLLTARRAAAQAARLAPDSTEYAMLLGYVCWRQQDHSQAIRALEGVVRRAPDEALAWRLLARAREASGDIEAARECYEHLLTLHPEDQWTRQLSEGSEP